MTNSETISALLSLVSAIASALAVAAAFRSAHSAEVAQHALLDIEERGRRREAASLVAQVRLEHQRAESLGKAIGKLYFGLAQVRSYSEARFDGLKETLEVELKKAAQVAAVVAPFTGPSSGLNDVPREDVDRIIINFMSSLAELRGLVERLEREKQAQESQLLQNRDAQLRAAP